MELVIHPLRRLYHRVGDSASGQYAEIVIALLFFVEAIIYVPADPILIIYCVKRPEKALRYATVATIGSVTGGILSYTIGWILWHYWGPQIIYNRFINYVISPTNFNYLCSLYQKHQYVALLVAGFSPVPFKAATLTAGFCRLSILPFIACAVIARGGRLFGIAYCVRTWGVRIQEYIDRYFNFLVLLKILIVVYIAWYLILR